MAGERRLPGLGLWGFWNQGSNSWKPGTDENNRRLSVLVQGAVSSRTAAEPNAPADGAVWIVPTTANSNQGKIGVRDNGATVYLDPSAGTRLYVVDTGTFAYFNGTTWVDEEAGEVFTFLGLSDTPDSFGLPGQILAVNGGADGLVFVDPPTGGGGGDPYPGDELPPITDQNGKFLAVTADGTGVEWVDPPAGGGGTGGIEEAPEDGAMHARQNAAWVPFDIPEIPDIIPPEVATYASVWRIEFTANQGNTTGLRIAKLELLDENGVDRITEAWLTASPYSGSDGMVSGVSDASLGTFYMSSANPTEAAPIFIEARFKEPVGISTVRMTAENTTNTTRLSYHPKSFRILADGQLDQTVTDLPAWTAALARSYTIGTEPGSFVAEAPPTGGPHVRDGSTGEWVPLAAPEQVDIAAYKIWRILVLETDSANIGFGEIEFRDVPGGTNLVGTGVARNGFGATGTTMASWFDKNTATDTYSAGGSVAANKWVEYEFLAPVEVGEVAIAGAAGNSTFQSSNVISYEVYGSNDGVNYDFLASRYNMARWPLSTVEVRTLAIPATRTVAGSVLSDAPKDGKLYGRRDGEWEEASSGGGAAEIPEPPNNGLVHGRRGDGTWQEIVTGGNFPVGNAPYGGALIVPAGPQSYTVPGAWDQTRYQSAAMDTDGFWSAANPNRLTIPAGITKVRLIANVRPTGGIGDNVFEFAKNGNREFPGGGAGSIPEGGYNTASATIVSGVIPVVAGDYFTLDYFVATSFIGSVDTFFALEVVERVDGSNTAINTPLRNLIDVDADAPSEGDSLVWDATAQKWVSRPAMNIAAGVNRPFKGAMARFNAAKTYASFPITVEWDGVDYDTDGFWSAASPVRLTVPPGVSKVRLTAELLPEVSWSTSNTSFLLSIRKNGAKARGMNEESRGTGDYTDAGISLVTGVLAVSPGDYFEVRFNSATSANGALHTLCSFSIEAVETTEIA